MTFRTKTFHLSSGPSVLAWGCGVAVAIFSPGIQAINGMVATVVLHVVFNLMANKKN